MLAALLVSLAIAIGSFCWAADIRPRRHEPDAMYVTTRPGVELEQPYGGWNADAYDAGTGRDRTLPPIAGGSALQAATWPDIRRPRSRMRG